MKQNKPVLFLKHSLLLLVTMLFLSGCTFFKEAIKEKPFNADESFEEANELMDEGFNEKARTLFETVLAKDASRKYDKLARIRIADTYFVEGSYDEAIAEYEGFLEINPYHRYAPYAQYKIAMSYYKRVKTVDVSYSWAKKALSEFIKLQQRYPRNPYMDAIENRIRTCNRYLAEYEFYVGNFYFKKESYKAAAQRFDNMLKEFPHSRKESEALYYLGLSYKNLGEKEKAVDTLSTLIDKFPSTKLSTEAKILLEAYNQPQDIIENK